MVYDIEGNTLGMVYDVEGNTLMQTYDIEGNPIFEPHAVSSTYTKSLILTNTTLYSGTQGIACDSLSQEIAQLYTGNIYLFDISDGSTKHVASVFNLGHGHTGQFAPTKSAGMDYPPLYVSAGTKTVNDINYSILLKVQCSLSSSEMVRAYAVSEESNLVGLIAVDFENNIIYHIHRSAYESSTEEYTYISAWDFTTMESTSEVTWTVPVPTEGVYILTNKIKTFNIPYVNEMQSVSFFDGLIVLFSDDGYVQFVDPISESIYLTISNDMPSFEREGVGFMYNSNTDQYDMILSNRTGSAMNFYRYEFDLS